MAKPTTRNLAILFTDIKGFTDKTSHKSRAAIQALLDTHKGLVLPMLEGKGGRLVKTIGDAYLMSYESPTDAVLAGVAVQEALSAHNAGRDADDRIEVRIAINAGEVVLSEDDVFGEPVNIAARIESVAVPGEVFFTEAVYLAMNKAEVPTSEVGHLQLKGIPEKVRVYKVKRERPLDPRGAAAAAAGPAFAPGEKARPVASAVPACYWKRAAALLFDFVLVSMLLGAVTRGAIPKTAVDLGKGGVVVSGGDARVSVGPAGVQVEGRERGGSLRHLAFAAAWVLYGFVLLGKWGATPGMRILGLSVVSASGGPPSRNDLLLRGSFSLVSGYAAGLGYLWAFFRKDRGTWHDLIAGTQVVEPG